MNYGKGYIAQTPTASYADCCDECAKNPKCLAWDWNSNGQICYVKDNSAAKAVENGRWSGKLPATAAPPGAATDAGANTSYFFTRGGTQGGEGINDPSWAGQWYIENVYVPRPDHSVIISLRTCICPAECRWA